MFVSSFATNPMKLCGGRQVAGWKLGRRIKQCIWSTNGSSSLIHLFFSCQFSDREANNTYLSRIGFLWSNNNDFIAHYISHPLRPSRWPHGVAAVNTVIVAKMKHRLRNYLLQPVQWDFGLVSTPLLINSLDWTHWFC